ncbi:MAG: HU family DNA-binding protein [Akkermansia sp.]|nr:HU family DNA-binding protein [Akkermansia sp.]
MNKTQLVDVIQTKLGEGATKKCAEVALSAVLAAIGESARKEKVQLVGFGTFEMKTRAARTGRNPQTGETLKIAASSTLSFKPSSAFKTEVKKTCSKKSCKKK